MNFDCLFTFLLLMFVAFRSFIDFWRTENIAAAAAAKPKGRGRAKKAPAEKV